MGDYDSVKRPSHYVEGREYEPKDVIRDWGLNFNLGSAVKYLSRAGRKGDVLEDLNKAKEFIQFECDAIAWQRGNADKNKRSSSEHTSALGVSSEADGQTQPRIAWFDRVSHSQFQDDWQRTIDKNGWLIAHSNLKMPSRATGGSAGYDFYSPIEFELKPGESITIPTGVRVRMSDGWVLLCFPRSGLGFKYRVQLDNTVGVIDSDYYYSDNEGHVMARITNDSHDGKSVKIEKGQAFMQGVFVPYGITVSDSVTTKRNGGFGSTDASVK